MIIFYKLKKKHSSERKFILERVTSEYIDIKGLYSLNC